MPVRVKDVWVFYTWCVSANIIRRWSFNQRWWTRMDEPLFIMKQYYESIIDRCHWLPVSITTTRDCLKYYTVSAKHFYQLYLIDHHHSLSAISLHGWLASTRHYLSTTIDDWPSVIENCEGTWTIVLTIVNNQELASLNIGYYYVPWISSILESVTVDHQQLFLIWMLAMLTSHAIGINHNVGN